RQGRLQGADRQGHCRRHVHHGLEHRRQRQTVTSPPGGRSSDLPPGGNPRRASASARLKPLTPTIILGDNTMALRLEVLEDRLVPAVTNPTNVVSGLYEQILQRSPDPSGLSEWTSVLTNGGSAFDVAKGLWTSAEFRSNQVNNYYSQYLHHPADDAGFNFWRNQLLSGQSEQAVMAGLLSSDEFYNNAGSHTAFINDLYQDLLGRSPDSTEQQGWITQLNNGVSRSAVVDGFLTSTEFRQVSVKGSYGWVLNREADAGGLSVWTNLEVNEFWLRTTSLNILASQENEGRLNELTGIPFPNPERNEGRLNELTGIP